ncbi:hypothetical protein ACJJI4_16945 [Microbulbifer sp. TRSA002]|uniref:hypothetical protein n=1 Tax=Microbulbifer sp. TRSA002 TaxID=3243382 RepID=UPI00403902C5
METIRTTPEQSGPDQVTKPLNNTSESLFEAAEGIHPGIKVVGANEQQLALLPPGKHRRLTARQRRALKTLVKRSCCREELDKVTGASNSPEIVSQLRKRGIAVKCRMEGHIDRDGIAGSHGVYWLPDSERQLVESLNLLED